MPGREAAARLLRARREPAGEGLFGRVPRLRLARLALVHELLRLRDGARGERRFVGDVRLRLAPGFAVLVDTVEERVETVVIRLRDGIELVRVALRAVQREAEPDGADRVHAVAHVVDARLFRIAPALAVR